MPSQLPAWLPSYYLRKMQMFVSLKIESVTAKLRAICKNQGTNSLKCLYARERKVRVRGLTDCSIRKPITTGWTNLPWCFNKSPAFLTLRMILLLPLDFVSGICAAVASFLTSVLCSSSAISVVNLSFLTDDSHFLQYFISQWNTRRSLLFFVERIYYNWTWF